jgi:hypothetical protein
MALVKVTLLLNDEMWGILEAREDGYPLEHIHDVLMEDPVSALEGAEVIAVEEYP